MAKAPASKMKKKPPKMGGNTPKVGDKREPKSFSVQPLSGEGEGEKILIYGKSGLGKTTISAQLDGAVFIPLDDGARKICNPITLEPVNAITGVESFGDLRDAVQQSKKLLDKTGVLVIDTLTRAQPLAEQWVVDNIRTDKGGQASNLESFGYGKGYRHVLDQFRLLLSDMDHLIRSGRSVVLLAQLEHQTVANPAGIDYLEEVPKLIQNKQGPIMTEVCEWVDHVLRLGYADLDVVKDDAKARAGKVISEDETRAVFSGGAQHFIAKSRPVNGERIPSVISFESESDNSLWQYIFPKETE